MPTAPVLPDAIAGRAAALMSPFVCLWTGGGLDATWVRVAGELDLATAPELLRTLRLPQLQARLVLLDLRELEFMDSSGVHAIVGASIGARRDGRRLVLLCGPPDVDRMFTQNGSFDDVAIGDVDPVEPEAGALRELAQKDLAP